ncbi:MAG TPA: hypothetical protein VN764_17495, partial [Polyangiaceae bacterium]|nr:hypothetical protein [Polyangiaceae bacterium]
LLECSIKFLRELVNREPIVIRSWGETYVGKIATVRQDMVRNQGEVCASAEFTIALFDVRARRLIDPTDEWLSAVGWSRSDWTPKN